LEVASWFVKHWAFRLLLFKCICRAACLR
jgi:hypothetical protein